MLRLARYSEKAGFVGTAVILFIWLFSAAIAIDSTNHFFASYSPIAATVIFALLVIFAALGGLIGFWLLVGHVDYWVRGYRVRWLTGDHWAYVERGSDQRIVPYMREVTGNGYPLPCTIRISDDDFPEWAVGRREEIVKRITICHGINQGGRIKVSQDQ